MIDIQIIVQRIYWGSYVVLIAFFVALRNSFRRGRLLRIFLLMVVGGIFVRARFIEPQQIVIKHTQFDLATDKTVALIADMHLGVYKDWSYLQRVVHEIKKQDVDMVLIAGDFLYRPTRDQSFIDLFAPLADLTVPVYAVLGNHDIPEGGNDNRYNLIQALEQHGVVLLHNDVIRVDDFYLVGLGPHLGGEDDVRILEKVSAHDDVVVMTHNPDTTTLYTNTHADVTLVGHTHCGQVRVPFFHNFLRPHYYPITGDFDCGRTEEKFTELYITPGLGETALPLRFQAPPTIDILHF